MPKVTYVEPDGTVTEVNLESGKSVMQGAVENALEGILAECGGSASCATCHCYVDEEWLAAVDEPDENENDMLDCVTERRPNSRLSCQIVVTEDHDGLVVKLPDSPY